MTRVLIIEDEESYREATAFMLRKEGFEVNTAANGADGLEIYSRNGADIVLLDLMMPGLPGTEVCRQLRQRGNVGIIMVTARDSEIDKVVGWSSEPTTTSPNRLATENWSRASAL
ncbi:phosphate regulon transcriptional regulatory protein PhoB [Cutibacterium acnes JCM 18920]|nr:phosphate regulon transcriptional regulatory protein PhoB [Cutibacterium acnes JCM 18920]